jgi:sterol desaturase/sphingolipid hydroxylase (fatty acid hydroxylase superfamily)
MALAAWYSAGNYYYIHRRAHLEPEWAKRKIPWHYDHHMNSNQDANWCVTKPWFDYDGNTCGVFGRFKRTKSFGDSVAYLFAKPLTQAVEKIFPAKWVEKKEKLELPSEVKEINGAA